MLSLTGLEWLVKNDAMARMLCRKSCRGREDLLDDLYGVCVDRVDGIAATYDPSWGTVLNTHMYKNLRWYLYKYMNKMEHAEGGVTEYDPARDDRAVAPGVTLGDLAAREEVQYILDRLCERHRVVLVMHVVDGFTFQEIADAMGFSKGTAINVYRAAISAALQEGRGGAAQDM